MVAEGRDCTGRFGSGGLCEVCGDPFRHNISTRNVFHRIAKLNDVRHRVAVEEGVVVEGHFEGLSQRVWPRTERCGRVANSRNEIEYVSSALEGMITMSLLETP